MDRENIDSEYLDMIIYNFKYAIENNKDKVYLGYKQHNEHEKSHYWCDKKEWIDTLSILLDEAIKLEEYEYCKELKQIKESLI